MARDELLTGLDTTGMGAATPVANATPAASPATGAGAERLETYEFPRFGYTLTYDSALWSAATMQGSGTISGTLIEQDTIELRNQANTVTVRITGEYGSFGTSNAMPSCAQNALLSFTIWDEREPLASPVPGGDGRAWLQADYEIDGVRTTAYVECRWLGGDVTLIIRHTAPAAEYPASVKARNELLAGLDTTGIIGENATLIASPVGIATPVASPVGTSTGGS